MVLSEGGVLLAIGLVLGAVGSVFASRVLEGLLYGVAPQDPITFVVVAVVIAAVGLGATLVPAVINLANIYYERDQLVEAEALYEKAVRIDPDCFEVYFNLGNIHHDLGRFSESVNAYSEALGINPGYPEAHFYLAVTLEKLGRSAEARIHWRAYQQLAPDGEFAELAKEFSE